MYKPRTLVLAIAATATAFALVLGSVIFNAASDASSASNAELAQTQHLARARSSLLHSPQDR